MALDQLQLAIITLLRGEKPTLSLGAPREQVAASTAYRLELVARGVAVTAELGTTVIAAGVALSAFTTTPSAMDSLDASGLRRLAARVALLAVITGFGAGAAVRWRQRFWRVQLVVGAGVAMWYLMIQGA